MEHAGEYRVFGCGWQRISPALCVGLWAIASVSCHSAGPTAPMPLEKPISLPQRSTKEPQSSPAPKEAVEQPALLPSDDRPKVTVKWQTESEEENFGFNILRSESENGPWILVNDKPIPGAGTTSLPQKYEYLDYSVERGKTYYYKLQDINYSGAAKDFSPVLSKLVE